MISDFNIAWLFTNDLFKKAIGKDFEVSICSDIQVKEDYWFILSYVNTVLTSNRQHSIEYYLPDMPELHILTSYSNGKSIGKLTQRRRKFLKLVTYYQGLALL